MMLPAANCVPLRRTREFACKAVVCTEAVRSEARRFSGLYQIFLGIPRMWVCWGHHLSNIWRARSIF